MVLKGHKTVRIERHEKHENVLDFLCCRSSCISFVFKDWIVSHRSHTALHLFNLQKSEVDLKWSSVTLNSRDNTGWHWSHVLVTLLKIWAFSNQVWWIIWRLVPVNLHSTLCRFTLTQWSMNLKYNDHILGIIFMCGLEVITFPLYGLCVYHDAVQWRPLLESIQHIGLIL